MVLQTLLNDYLLMEIQLKKLIHRLSVLRPLALLLLVRGSLARLILVLGSPVIQNLDLKLQVEL